MYSSLQCLACFHTLQFLCSVKLYDCYASSLQKSKVQWYLLDYPYTPICRISPFLTQKNLLFRVLTDNARTSFSGCGPPPSKETLNTWDKGMGFIQGRGELGGEGLDPLKGIISSQNSPQKQNDFFSYRFQLVFLFGFMSDMSGYFKDLLFTCVSFFFLY